MFLHNVLATVELFLQTENPPALLGILPFPVQKLEEHRIFKNLMISNRLGTTANRDIQFQSKYNISIEILYPN